MPLVFFVVYTFLVKYVLLQSPFISYLSNVTHLEFLSADVPGALIKVAECFANISDLPNFLFSQST